MALTVVPSLTYTTQLPSATPVIVTFELSSASVTVAFVVSDERTESVPAAFVIATSTAVSPTATSYAESVSWTATTGLSA